eukprot:1142063-Pelagomonas_calceolata.AAC.1
MRANAHVSVERRLLTFKVVVMRRPLALFCRGCVAPPSALQLDTASSSTFSPGHCFTLPAAASLQPHDVQPLGAAALLHVSKERECGVCVHLHVQASKLGVGCLSSGSIAFMGGPCKQLAERGQGDLQVRVLMQRCVLGSAAGCCRLRVSNGPLVEGFKMLAALLVSNRWHLPNDNVSNPLSGATIPMLRAGQLNPQLPRANAFESVLAKCEESGGLAYSLKAWSYGSWMIQAPTLLDEFRTLVVKKIGCLNGVPLRQRQVMMGADPCSGVFLLTSCRVLQWNKRPWLGID